MYENINQNPSYQEQKPPYQEDPFGYTGIVKLIVLSIVTLGIYIFIWIHRVGTLLYSRNCSGVNSTPGVQVVLCLFVPFYILYWAYKQSKAIQRFTGTAEDLSLISILLCVFGFSIVAFALMQDQLNKFLKPAASPAYEFYPSPAPQAAQAEPQAEEPAPQAEEPAPQAEEPAPATQTETPAPATQAETASVTDDQIDSIMKLKKLLDEGILTQEEFDTKKKEILSL